LAVLYEKATGVSVWPTLACVSAVLPASTIIGPWWGTVVPGTSWARAPPNGEVWCHNTQKFYCVIRYCCVSQPTEKGAASKRIVLQEACSESCTFWRQWLDTSK